MAQALRETRDKKSREQKLKDRLTVILAGRQLGELKPGDLIAMQEAAAGAGSIATKAFSSWLLDYGVSTAVEYPKGTLENTLRYLATGSDVKLDLSGAHLMELKVRAQKDSTLGTMQDWGASPIRQRHIARMIYESVRRCSLSTGAAGSILDALRESGLTEAHQRDAFLEAQGLIPQPGGYAIRRERDWSVEMARKEYLRKWGAVVEISERRLGYAVKRANNDIAVRGNPWTMRPAQLGRLAAWAKLKVFQASSIKAWNHMSAKQKATVEGRKASAQTARNESRDLKQQAVAFDESATLRASTRGATDPVLAREHAVEQRLMNVPRHKRDDVWRHRVRSAGLILARAAVREGRDVSQAIADVNGSAFLLLGAGEVEALAPPSAVAHILQVRTAMLEPPPAARATPPQGEGGSEEHPWWAGQEAVPGPADDFLCGDSSSSDEEGVVAIRVLGARKRAPAIPGFGKDRKKGGKVRRSERRVRRPVARRPRDTQLASSHGEVTEGDDVDEMRIIPHDDPRAVAEQQRASRLLTVWGFIALMVVLSVFPDAAREKVCDRLLPRPRIESTWSSSDGAHLRMHSTNPRAARIASSHGEITEGDDHGDDTSDIIREGIHLALSFAGLVGGLVASVLLAGHLGFICWALFAMHWLMAAPARVARVDAVVGQPGLHRDVAIQTMTKQEWVSERVAEKVRELLRREAEDQARARPDLIDVMMFPAHIIPLAYQAAAWQGWSVPFVFRCLGLYTWALHRDMPTNYLAHLDDIDLGDVCRICSAQIPIPAGQNGAWRRALSTRILDEMLAAQTAAWVNGAGDSDSETNAPSESQIASSHGEITEGDDVPRKAKGKKGGAPDDRTGQVRVGEGAGAEAAIVEAHAREEACVAADVEAAKKDEAAPEAEFKVVELPALDDGTGPTSDVREFCWYSFGLNPHHVVCEADLNKLHVEKARRGGYGFTSELERPTRSYVTALAVLFGLLATVTALIAMTILELAWMLLNPFSSWAMPMGAALSLVAAAVAIDFPALRPRDVKGPFQDLAVFLYNRSRLGIYSFSTTPYITFWRVTIIPGKDTAGDTRAPHHLAEKMVAQERRCTVTVSRRVILRNGWVSKAFSSVTMHPCLEHALHAFSGNPTAAGSAATLEQVVHAWVNIAVGDRRYHLPVAERPSVTCGMYWAATAMSASQVPRSLNWEADVLAGWH